MLIWDLNSAKSILVNFDQINDKHWGLCLLGKQFEGSGESSNKTQTLCICVCTFTNVSPCMFDYLHASVWHSGVFWTKRHHGGSCPCTRQPYIYISTFSCTLLVDWQGMNEVGANDWCRRSWWWQLNPASFLSFLFAWSSACWFQIPVGLFVILTDTSKRARTAKTPKEFHREAASPRVCFTFNDAHIRELGGSLLPLSPRGSAPDYSLASDSLWWMA